MLMDLLKEEYINLTFSFDCLLKSIDPVVASALDRALSDKDVSVEQATELFDLNGETLIP